jgi:hypothetical protein
MDQMEGIVLNSVKSKELNGTKDSESSAINLSVETLIDCLIVLYDECQNSSLRREKNVEQFIELCK